MEWEALTAGRRWPGQHPGQTSPCSPGSSSPTWCLQFPWTLEVGFTSSILKVRVASIRLASQGCLSLATMAGALGLLAKPPGCPPRKLTSCWACTAGGSLQECRCLVLGSPQVEGIGVFSRIIWWVIRLSSNKYFRRYKILMKGS